MISRKKQYINKKPHRMIVVSLDAVGTKDLELLENLPHFQALLARGAICRQVKSVCPSLTYPAHVSIRTGFGKGGLSEEPPFMTRLGKRG